MTAEVLKQTRDGGDDPDPGSGSAPRRSNGNGHSGAFYRVLAWLGLKKSHESTLREAVEEVLEEHEEHAESTLNPEEKSLIQNILNFGEITVSDVMIPQSEMVTVERDVSQDELVRLFIEQRHTRLPVCEGSIDHISGFIHVKDMLPVLGGGAPFSMTDLLRNILFVPPSMRIVDLLIQMRQSAVHMAIVVDEYGGTSGLVTLEDLFEEIVGEIHDEHDAEDQQQEAEPIFSWNSGGSVVVDAATRIDKLEEDLDIRLVDEEEDFDTLGGLIFSNLGRVPRRGETAELESSGIRIEVLDADERRINKVRLVQLEPAESLA